MTDRDDTPLTDEERVFAGELLSAARRLDRPDPELADRVRSEIGRRLHDHPSRSRRLSLRVWTTVGVSLAAAAALVVWLGRHERESSMVRPERVWRTRVPSSQAPFDPCTQRFHAPGAAPRIDDFEDGDVASSPLEGRGDPWFVVLDIDPEGGAHTPVIDRKPEGSRTNRWALHLKGPELRAWGAQAMLSFRKHACYDASAYAGLRFSIKGPGRLFVGVEGVGQTPRKWGGTCDSNCYNDHLARVDVGKGWQTVELRWSELRQRGYEGQPLDARSVSSLLFVVRAEDTPFDLWIDDVAFLAR